jgi:hypothetical protein
VTQFSLTLFHGSGEAFIKNLTPSQLRDKLFRLIVDNNPQQFQEMIELILSKTSFSVHLLNKGEETNTSLLGVACLLGSNSSIQILNKLGVGKCHFEPKSPKLALTLNLLANRHPRNGQKQ